MLIRTRRAGMPARITANGRAAVVPKRRLVSNAGENCGTGAGGFKAGNRCAVGGAGLTEKEVGLVSDWREHLWNRALMTRLTRATVAGGRLSHLHPGAITVYRGRPPGSKPASAAKGASWTKSRAVAERWAEGGAVEELRLTAKTPALDVGRALAGVPSKSEHEQEVFVVRNGAANVVTANEVPGLGELADYLLEELSPPPSKVDARRIARELLDGWANEDDPEDIAARIADVADVDDARALAIAQTETARMQRAGQLDVLEAADPEALVRWVATAGACPYCRARAGRVYTLEAAADVLPAHPHCYCEWKEVKRLRAGKRVWDVEDVADEGDDVENMFCPTGPGGGVDPSCGKSSTKVSLADSAVKDKWVRKSMVLVGDPTKGTSPAALTAEEYARLPVVYHGRQSGHDALFGLRVGSAIVPREDLWPFDQSKVENAMIANRIAVLRVPDVRQPDGWSCGAAAAMAVGMRVGAGPATIEEWKALCGTDRTGTRPGAIAAALRGAGLDVDAAAGMTVEDLRRWTALRARPVIVPVRDWRNPADPAGGHYLVVLGVAELADGTWVHAHDPRPGPQGGAQTIPAAAFEAAWADRGADGATYVRFGIAAGAPAHWAVANAEGDNCGTGAGGFQPGNTCGKGGASSAIDWSSVKVPPHESWRDLEADPAYAYHATNLERAGDVAGSRLKPHGPSHGTDQEAWPDGSTDKRIYFTDKPATAWQFAPEDGRPALLRVARSSVKLKKESTGDLYLTKSVSAGNIEMLTTEGWRLVAQQTANAAAASFWSRCERDEHGHCLAGSGGAGGRIARAVGKKVGDRYGKLQARYGRAGAIAVMAGIAATLPAPVPGSSLAVIGVAEGIRAAHHLIRRYAGRRRVVNASTLPTGAAAAFDGEVQRPPRPDVWAMTDDAHALVAELHAEHKAPLDPRFHKPALAAAIRRALLSPEVTANANPEGHNQYTEHTARLADVYARAGREHRTMPVQHVEDAVAALHALPRAGVEHVLLHALEIRARGKPKAEMLKMARQRILDRRSAAQRADMISESLTPTRYTGNGDALAAFEAAQRAARKGGK